MEEVVSPCALEVVVDLSISAPNLLLQPGINQAPIHRLEYVYMYTCMHACMHACVCCVLVCMLHACVCVCK